ncbi:unnamed protein product, partial [Owenia fusiformis]
TECNIECLKTPKCGQTNVEKLGARRWNCDLFGWGTGQTEDSPDHLHYVMIQNRCENGSKFFYNGSTYCFNQGPLSWTDAENKCIEDGSILVAIETEDEQTALANYLLSNDELRDKKFHIGLNDRAEENQFIWTGLLVQATFFNWNAGEPNNDINEECVAMNYQTNFYWYDIGCSDYLFGYICERQSTTRI